MATKKKSTAKKSTSKKAAKKPAKMESFKISRNDPPFFTLRVTKQTVYWSILLIFILVTQLWILNAQLDVIQTLDSITNP